MTKRTHSSVTEELCVCNYLQNAAEDPQNPIEFDPSTSEYQFAFGGAMLVIYHCPFCGGERECSADDAATNGTYRLTLLTRGDNMDMYDPNVWRQGHREVVSARACKEVSAAGAATGIAQAAGSRRRGITGRFTNTAR